jgi:hypothetical protein
VNESGSGKGARGGDLFGQGRAAMLNKTEDSSQKAAKFANYTTDLNWETLAQRRKTARLCALFKAYTGERAWKAIGDRLQRPHYLCRVDHNRKIRNRKQRTDIGKFSFVNRTIQLWNKLPADALGTFP